MNKNSIRNAVGIGVGSVLFFLLGRFVVISSPIDTVNICVQYGLLAALSVTTGPLTGALTGLLGHMLIDWSWGEFCWSWIIASAAFGGLMGVMGKITRINLGPLTGDSIIKFNLMQVATHIVCWAGIAPVLELAIYNESMDRIFEQGLTAAISNALTTAIVGTALLAIRAAIGKNSKS